MHIFIEFPRGTFSVLKTNLGNVFFVLLMVKYVGDISYDWAKGILSFINDCSGYKKLKNIINYNFWMLQI